MEKLNLVRTTILAGSLLLQLTVICFPSHGAAGDVDLSFDPGSGTVWETTLQSDGNVLIAGDLLAVDGVPRGYIARLYGDFGSPVPSLNIARSNSFMIVS
jgi:hypothetical protein